MGSQNICETIVEALGTGYNPVFYIAYLKARFLHIAFICYRYVVPNGTWNFTVDVFLGVGVLFFRNVVFSLSFKECWFFRFNFCPVRDTILEAKIFVKRFLRR